MLIAKDLIKGATRTDGFGLAVDQIPGQVADVVLEIGQDLLAVGVADRDGATPAPIIPRVAWCK